MISRREDGDCAGASLAVPVRPLERLWLFAFLGLFVIVPYFAVQHHIVFQVRMVPATTLDRLLPFFPPAILFYLSLYAQVTLPLMLARDSRELRQMAFGFGWIAVVSNTLFFFWPTAIAPARFRRRR